MKHRPRAFVRVAGHTCINMVLFVCIVAVGTFIIAGVSRSLMLAALDALQVGVQ